MSQQAIGGIYFTTNSRAEAAVQPGSEFDCLKPWLTSGIVKCFSRWLNESVCCGDHQGFLKEGIRT
jgi:hypothetical protein